MPPAGGPPRSPHGPDGPGELAGHGRPGPHNGPWDLSSADRARIRAEQVRYRLDTGPHRGFHERAGGDRFGPVAHGPFARQIDLQRQYDYYHTGDVARRLHLHDRWDGPGDWRGGRYCGRVSPSFVSLHFGGHYCGPSWYPSRVWWPHWNDWVQWSWWNYCYPVYDPRPVYCRPILYDPCPRITVFSYPVWEPLYVTTSGTWVDVPPVVVQPEQVDLQLLAVRFVDAGHPEQKLGPRFRVWFRNNSGRDLATPFNVSVIAANDDRLQEGLPQAGVRVDAVAAGTTQVVDVRLPWEVYELGRDASGKPVAFSKLHVIVDSHGEIGETSESNNGILLDRQQILPVDPAAFSTDVDTVTAGGVVNVAGEGFGPEPGRVLVYVKDLELDAEIQGWYDLGVRVKMPDLRIAAPLAAELVVVRGDGAAANPLQITLAPPGVELLPAP